MCTRSIGSVHRMGSKPGFCILASNCIHLAQLCTLQIVSCIILGHQNRSLIRLRVQSQPWCPVCWWHPSIAAWCLWVGTINASMSSLLQLGVVLRYSRPLLRTKSFCRAANWCWTQSSTCPCKNWVKLLWSFFGHFNHSVVSRMTGSLYWAMIQWLSTRLRMVRQLSSSIFASSFLMMQTETMSKMKVMSCVTTEAHGISRTLSGSKTNTKCCCIKKLLLLSANKIHYVIEIYLVTII